MARLLVVGVQPKSLGWHVAERAIAEGWEVACADIEGGLFGDHKDYKRPIQSLDVTSIPDQHRFWTKAPNFNSVVYAAGVNAEASVYDDNWRSPMAKQMAVNFAGAIETLQRWLTNGRDKGRNNQFVTIASNSAYIPRSTGLGYCASKAAVVMAMRCAAREIAARSFGGDYPAIYTYSPGWLTGTPMSEAVRQRFGGGDSVPLHRIPGGVGIDPASLAQTILRNLSVADGRMFNGTDIRIDGGEI